MAELEDNEMSFVDHLEALRGHIIRSVLAVLVLAILAFVNKHFIFDVVFLGPFRLDFWTYRKMCEFSQLFNMGDSMCIKDMGFQVINTTMSGQFAQHIGISLTTGIVLAFPYATWELWRFLKPAFSPRERRFTRGIVLSSTLLFLMGLLFGYYLITPVTVQFLGSYRLSNEVGNFIDIGDYISTVTMTTISIALVFELPMVVYFLSRAAIVTPPLMRQYRKHAIVVIFILSAILTPSTDMLTMVLVSIPFIVLYELSILVSYFVNKRRIKNEEYEDLHRE